MTENEAISVLKMVEAHGSLTSKAKDMAIQALEELQQYRAIGTVKGYEDAIQSSIENYNLYREYKAKVQEYEAELKFLKQWKEDVMEGFCKYDASSVEEIAVHARNKAIDDFTAKLIKHISNVPGYRIGGGNVFVIADEMKGGA